MFSDEWIESSGGVDGALFRAVVEVLLNMTTRAKFENCSDCLRTVVWLLFSLELEVCTSLVIDMRGAVSFAVAHSDVQSQWLFNSDRSAKNVTH